jgi:two-component system LytT family sensor kinase
VETIGRLRELLRVSLSHDRPQEVSLARELELVEGYLGIQRVRFADRLVVAYDIQPNVLDAIVPSMILQPLVENSIKHGFSRKVGPGSITIRSHRENGRAVIEVEDDGMGFFVEALDQPMASGIGLSNVRERLRVIYGTTYQLKLSSEPGKGTLARIEVPELAFAHEQLA